MHVCICIEMSHNVYSVHCTPMAVGRVRIVADFNTNASEMHTCMSGQQWNLVYSLEREVPKLMYAFWTCKPVLMTIHL